MLGPKGAFLALALMAITSTHARSVDVAVDSDLANDVIGDIKQDVVFSGRAVSPPTSWLSIARCAVSTQPLDCVEARSQVAVDALLAQMSEARAASDEGALEPEVVDKVAELSETMLEAASAVLERKLGLGQDDGDGDGKGLVEEGRGKKKKKKIQKLIALVKLVLLVLVVKLKLAFIMMGLQTLFQFKLVAMVFLILLTKKVSLWALFKQAKGGDAQKVIYYEHAQHQHHYDEHGGGGGWGGGHDEHADAGAGGAGGGGGWNLWGRSYDTLPGQVQGQVQGQAPIQDAAQGVQSGVYKAADGSRIVLRQPGDAHDLAYPAQRP